MRPRSPSAAEEVDGVEAGARLRVLVVDDSDDDVVMVARALRRGGFSVRQSRVADPDALREALSRGGWDLVVSEFETRAMSGLAALAAVRAAEPDPPFVFVSSRLGEETAVAALRSGAQDFVAKGDLRRLPVVAARETREAAHRRERRRAEAEVRELNASLERRVRERTAELEASNRALEAAKAQAEKASAAKNEFLSRMSHELRTPLNAVLGFAQLLEMESLSEEQASGVRAILRAGRHLLDLINEVLDLTRIESGNLSVSLEPVPAGEVVAEVLDLASGVASTRGARLRTELSAARGPTVFADRQRLRQVLLNLVANAVKYGRDGGAVTVTAMSTARDGRCRLSVVDDGPGIAPRLVPRLFTAFDRLGAESSTVEGTGLGLALSRRLTELMGGEIGYDSAPGGGSEFWVELALAAEAQPAAGASRERTSALSATDARRVVLYIEDNLPNFKVVSRALARLPGVEIVEAIQGRVGLDLARARRPDLILLDLHLPDLPGEEVLSRLKADPELAATPVVVLSADALPRTVARVVEAGAADFLTKPLDLRRFLKVVRDRLGVDAKT
ncbi:MAG: response regulator [Polyangiales bacterium]